MDFTHKNHYKFGWGEGLYNFHEKSSGPFWTAYSKVDYEPGPDKFRVESVRAARLIAESAQKPLSVMYSGGMDSEVVILCLMEIGADFECIISRYDYRGTKNINSYDTSYAFDFCKRHNLKTRVIDIDLENFLLQVYPLLADRFKCISRTWLLHTHVLSQFPDRHVICGGGDIQLNRYMFEGRSPSPDKIDSLRSGLYIDERAHIVAAYESALSLGTNCSLRFFRYTAELMLAWLQDDDVRRFITYEKSLAAYWTVVGSCLQMSFLHLKPWVFHRYWPELIPRVKYHGFERIPDWFYVPGARNVSTVVDEKMKNVITDVYRRFAQREPSFKIDVQALIGQLTGR